jgi:hypothetical protein
MKLLTALLATSLLATLGCATTKQEAEWKPLFNGKDLSEFIVEDGTATYEVKDGVITGTTAIPSPNTFLATKASYADFELVFDVKVDDKLNSGVQIRSRSRTEAEGKSKVGRFYGPQVEIEAGPGQSGYIYGEAISGGWRSPEPKSKDPAVNQHNLFKNGEWNHYRIIAQGARIQTFINGQPVADLTDEEIYKTHPEGHIGLQVHGIKEKLHPMQVSWKNLYIRELGAPAPAADEWISLFNGKDLDGWIIKVTGSESDENPGNIFRVEDGLLTVSFDEFDEFGGRFGHIFIDQPFTNYHFRCEYRFTGEQSKGGPSWAHANSGAMLSGQHPSTMGKDQKFPNSIEFQFLAQDESGTRPTGSICTPGTYIDFNGKTTRKHVIKSSEKALPMGEWVVAEAIVKNGELQHLINGKVVIEYTNPRFDDGTPVSSGYISLQAESHPCQFRNIEIQILD